MIIAAKKIKQLVKSGDIEITPFDESYLDVNSYSFHLGHTLIEYYSSVVDPHIPQEHRRIKIPETGYRLDPDHFYLAATHEKMGSRICASELYANFSTAACGMFIQTSAPLGHTGAVINWTLEIIVAQPIMVYPGMKIGKICFWQNFGDLSSYEGRYQGSEDVIATRIHQDFQP
ncbi:deoxycytidine triphosphate deaminase [Mixta theicola]|uniref:Deoxycytidine triphosphate deaminase n=1 Tax=Mixta theicola TaxID=1458355 RepID=A0A2K1Q6K2_9GAMM|nr:deoxycytidine triphosphate deaminase [Mixta theicola]PNS10684.1 deoxycytidine triphosphate deaminase [Mixta theicola]GLR10926.1 deoxycytidine triphosphate deaminase [Mixta theicola]